MLPPTPLKHFCVRKEMSVLTEIYIYIYMNMCQVDLLITEIPFGGWNNGYGPFGSYTAD